MNERNDPDPAPENQPAPTGDGAAREGRGAGTEPGKGTSSDAGPAQGPKSVSPDPLEQKKRRRRRRRPPQDTGLERISQVHYCRTDAEANQYLALGPEWDLQDIIPMRVETEDGGERDEVHFVVARWENERDRARLRKRDRRGVPRRPRE